MSQQRAFVRFGRIGFGVSAAAFAAFFSSTHADAMTFSLTPVTVTTPNFAGTISITGTVSMGVGETFLNPNVMSAVWLPFLPSFTAGFNGPGQNWDAGFLAWNGIGTYSGAIYNHQINAGNLGYAGGMPLGLYNFNPLGPGGQQPAIRLNYVDANGSTQQAIANYAIQVVPAPGGAALLGVAGLCAFRRRR
ncbi:MAG: hypothetical protein JNM86_08855 [Phycisphaerae bacterium]|nr:hypothetical protein [Phycisphaerae bacterium]MBN8597879.1 hypothetical protein [Planctomycetota bacterium]